MTTQNTDTSQQQTSVQRGLTSGSGLRVVRGLIRGVVGGLIATVLMTLYRFPVFRALPPTADFWAKYVGSGDAEAYPGIGLLLHFLYGGVAGGLFGVGISLLDFRNERERRLGVIGLSLVYSLALSAFGTRVLFRYLLDEELESDETVIFHVGHVIYGLTLGTWIGFRERKGEVYE
ncbi:hypothetical protein [Halorubrum lacusprofundi]|jgi:hypothetical protein|uniref:DUF1440 domain-containing protein n=1 Tax=Halorubrum lacusprofundi (strain ATCC 49239 / DSM 5036 / JCM 8891 / ACAM 34) TaxID=416348 RepID=B9LMZ4_HALLT|nr:hypothetical protein [Halorubrum lacusprofundi]ACM56732.1 hypothetical protein Hlac_1138 [Halorubrum lacusprofundi ATCC 49239]MCG1005004.1 hypothetical protein [Halorubrum lacusprofundi]